MIRPGERVLVAVSGGKDSLALWDLLLDARLSTPTGSTSGWASASTATVVRLLRPRLRRAPAGPAGRDRPAGRLRLRHPHRRRRRPAGAVLGVRAVEAPPVQPGRRSTAATTWSPPATTSTTRPRCCSATCCAGTWPTSAASTRCCPAGDGFVRKVKPLIRLGERETAAYCVLRGIDYIVEECPMAAGNRHLGYKEALNAIESTSPGSKAAFYFGFLDRVAPLVAAGGARRRSPACIPAPAAGRRLSARCAPSAGWSIGREDTDERRPARQPAPCERT